MVVKVAVAGLLSYAAYRAVKAFAPEGVQSFLTDVREGMAERETQLRDALGLEAGISDLTPEQARALVEDPTGPGTPRGPQG